ncbi:HAMP domain-containing protein, partial [Microvirga sp. GCM10011540]|uniref:HAMP domain-containing protein n=1 Tax=Microvirga sp. GCM10011540 TaxID=3317338 RepID=UPI00360CE9A9
MRLLNNLRLVTKLAIPVAIFVAIAVGLIALARGGLESLANGTQEIVQVDATRLKLILQLNADVNQATIQEKNILVDKDLEARATYAKRYEEDKQAAVKDLENLLASATTPETQAAFEGLKATVMNYFTLTDQSVAHGLKGYMDDAAMTISNGEGRDARIKVRSILAEQADISANALERSRQQANEYASRTSWTLIVSAAVGLSVAVSLIAAIAIYGIVRPLSAITGAMSHLAEGDLNVSVSGAERGDEVGQLARALQVFKDNAIEAKRLAAEQEAENDAKMRRAQVLDQLTKQFDANVSALTQGLASAATEMEVTARSMRDVADQATGRSVSVASAAEQTSSNVQTVAAATE